MATTEIYTLSLHDALPILGMIVKKQFFITIWIISSRVRCCKIFFINCSRSHIVHKMKVEVGTQIKDRKSTRLNSSHVRISYAVFCLKKKKKNKKKKRKKNK